MFFTLFQDLSVLNQIRNTRGTEKTSIRLKKFPVKSLMSLKNFPFFFFSLLGICIIFVPDRDKRERYGSYKKNHAI